MRQIAVLILAPPLDLRNNSHAAPLDALNKQLNSLGHDGMAAEPADSRPTLTTLSEKGKSPSNAEK
jgi:hypothetical protein